LPRRKATKMESSMRWETKRRWGTKRRSPRLKDLKKPKRWQRVKARQKRWRKEIERRFERLNLKPKLMPMEKEKR